MKKLNKDLVPINTPCKLNPNYRYVKVFITLIGVYLFKKQMSCRQSLTQNTQA